MRDHASPTCNMSIPALKCPATTAKGITGSLSSPHKDLLPHNLGEKKSCGRKRSSLPSLGDGHAEHGFRSCAKNQCLAPNSHTTAILHRWMRQAKAQRENRRKNEVRCQRPWTCSPSGGKEKHKVMGPARSWALLCLGKSRSDPGPAADSITSRYGSSPGALFHLIDTCQLLYGD